MNKIKKIIICAPAILILFGILTPVAFAQVKIPKEYIDNIEQGTGKIPLKELMNTGKANADGAPTGTSGINYLLQKIASGLLYIAAPLAVLFVVHGGVSYTMAFGDNTKIEAAKKELIWATLGLLVILISVVIVRIFISFFFYVDEEQPAASAATQTEQGVTPMPFNTSTSGIQPTTIDTSGDIPAPMW